MGTGYTRNDSANNIADGNVINASDLDGEFDAVQAAFNGSTGHSHDGTTGEGPQIATGGLADNAVTTAKITDANVTTAKIADSNVTTAKIADSNVTTAKIANSNVTLAKMAANSVDSDQYVDGSIDTAHIANDAVTGDKLANNIQIAGTLGVTGETTLTTHLNMGDNDIIKLGAGADLQIYHSGVGSYIDDVGTGNLFIRANDFRVGKYTGEFYLKGNSDGNVELYYDNALKLATTATGIDVTGNVVVSGNVDGRDVASDGSKLDGIESGATADQTASEILTLIKTVDGSGSGLDADTLDGVTSGSFLRSDAEDTKTAGALNFNDNILARFGTGNDLQIYHDGSNSYIIDQGTGQLRIRASNLQLQDSSGHIYIEGVDTGTGGTVTLYHNAVAKLATKSDGVDITGELQADSLDIDGVANISATLTMSGGNIDFADGVEARFGNGADLRIYHDGSNSYIDDAGQGNLRIRGNDGVYIQKYTGEPMIYAVADGAVTLYYDNASKLNTTSTGINIDGDINAVDNIYLASHIYHEGDTNTYMQFHAADQWRVVTGAAERLEVNNSTLTINDGGFAYDFRVESDTSTHMLFVDGSANRVGINDSTPSYTLDVGGDINFTGTLRQNGTAFSGGGGLFKGENGEVGSSAGDIFRVHEQTLNTNVTIDSDENGLCAGPLTIATGVTLTVNGNLSIV